MLYPLNRGHSGRAHHHDIPSDGRPPDRLGAWNDSRSRIGMPNVVSYQNGHFSTAPSRKLPAGLRPRLRRWEFVFQFQKAGMRPETAMGWKADWQLLDTRTRKQECRQNPARA